VIVVISVCCGIYVWVGGLDRHSLEGYPGGIGKENGNCYFFLREYELRIRMLGYRWEIGLDWVDAENIGTWG